MNESRVQNRKLRLTLDALLLAKPVPSTETKAFGCTTRTHPDVLTMPRIFCLLFWAFLFCLPILATGPLVPIDESGFQKLVDSHKGKVVLYDFWATWCAPCRAELPQLVLLEDKLRSKGVEMITISADDREHRAAAERFIQMFRVQGPAYLKQAADDDRFINAIDPNWGGALPALFLYDKAGHRVRSFIGETDMAALERAIDKLL